MVRVAVGEKGVGASFAPSISNFSRISLINLCCDKNNSFLVGISSLPKK